VHIRTPALSILLAALAACSSTAILSETPRGDRVGSFNGAKIDVLAEGGFAALAVRHAVSHDDHRFLYTNRHLCTQICDAPLDSASGALTAAATDSLFNIVLGQDPFSLKDDYGTSRGADMFAYTVTIVAEGKTKTVHFDDGNMPDQMRTILQAVQGIVAAARR
jgi:emfourin